MIYVDSSILLELYLDGPRATDARAILDEPETKVASWLLTVEIPVVLRRRWPPIRNRCRRRWTGSIGTWTTWG